MKINNETIARIYLVFVMFLPNTFNLINQPGLPLISARRAFIILWAVIFVLLAAKSKSILVEVRQFPLYRNMVAFVLTLGVVMLLTISNNSQTLLGYSTIVFEAVLPVLLFWPAFKDRNSLHSAVRLMIYMYSLMALYGVFDQWMGANPLLDIFSQGEFEGRKLTYTYEDFERGGIEGRAQSLFAHSIVFGYLSAVILIVLVGIQRTLNLISRKMYLAIGALMIVSILLAGSRSPMLLLLAAFLAYLAHGDVAKIFRAVGVFLIFIIVASGSGLLEIVLGKYYQLVSSMFLDIFSNESSFGGSSLGMRMMQLDAALSMFWESPIWGHGFAYIRTLLEDGMSGDLLGGESFAFSLLIEMGLIGIVAYVILFAGIYMGFRKYIKQVSTIQQRDLSMIGIALLVGHLVFIFVTGELATSPVFLMLVSLLLRLIYIEHCNTNNVSTQRKHGKAVYG